MVGPNVTHVGAVVESVKQTWQMNFNSTRFSGFRECIMFRAISNVTASATVFSTCKDSRC